jgi:predicted RND superfamily exporter protein
LFLHIVLKFSIKLIGNCIIFVGIFSEIMKNWIIRFRLPIVLLFTGITLLSILLLPRLQVNPDLGSYVPDGMGNKKYMKQLDSIFGGSEMVLVMLQAPDVVNHSTLSRLRVLKEELGLLDGIDRIISPFDAQEISIQDGFMVMDPLLDPIPESEVDCEVLKSKIAKNTMASPFFGVEDFSVVSLMLMKNLEVSNTQLIEKIDSVVNIHPGPEEVLLGGMPYVRYSINKNINKDLAVLLPVALLLMIIMLYTAFREMKGVLLPFIVVVMSLILSFGVMALLGWKISI